MTIETEELRREIEGLSIHPQTRRYSPELQGRVTAWAMERRAAGMSVPQMCGEVGIGEPTLRRFFEEKAGRRKKKKRKSPSFRRVKVAPTTAPQPPGRLVVHGPYKTRLEGFTVSDVVELFQRLACSA